MYMYIYNSKKEMNIYIYIYIYIYIILQDYISLRWSNILSYEPMSSSHSQNQLYIATSISSLC